MGGRDRGVIDLPSHITTISQDLYNIKLMNREVGILIPWTVVTTVVDIAPVFAAILEAENSDESDGRRVPGEMRDTVSGLPV